MLRELSKNEMEIVSGGHIDGENDPLSFGFFGDLLGSITDFLDIFDWFEDRNEPTENSGYDVGEFSPVEGLQGVFTRDNGDGTRTNLVDHNGDGLIDYAETYGNGIYTADGDLDGNPDLMVNVPL